jgi:hypothetical protein
MFRRWWTSFIAWFDWRKSSPSSEIKGNSSEIQSPSAEPEAELPVQPLAQLGNRHQRRSYAYWERQRRKHDKLVTPGGSEPVKVEKKSPAKIKPDYPALPEIDHQLPTQCFIAEHHEGGEVLFEESELYGQFNFRDTILNQLDRYWIYLARMKRNDADAFGFYRQLGGHLLPLSTTGIEFWRDERYGNSDFKKVDPLPEWFNKTRPGFGCFAFAADSHSENIEKKKFFPRFFYFVKYKQPPPEVQPMSGGDVYAVTVWWDKDKDKNIKYGSPTQYAVFIDRSGKTVKLLKTLDTKMIKIPRRGKRPDTVPYRAWHIPEIFSEWANDHKAPVDNYLLNLFVMVTRLYENCLHSMLRVEVHKNDLTAVFGLDERRTAYFFQDRDYQLNKHGQRKRIFHSVKAHFRHGVAVPFHFRGEREFDWAGYRVKITIPGRDFLHLNDFDVGVVDEYWIDKKEQKEFIYQPEFAKIITGWMRDGTGKWKNEQKK